MAEEIRFTIKGKDESGGAFKSASSNLKSLVSAGAKVAAGVTAAATAIVLFTNKIATADNKVAKFAQRLGVSTESLSTYQFVASQAGIETEKFNQSVQKLTVLSSQAAQGMGAATGAFAELGIKASDFSKLPLDKKLLTLSSSLNNAKSESDKLRIATQLFGDEGASMLQMLGKGSKAMEKAAADAKFLGATLDESGAKKAENFKAAMGRASAAMGGVSSSIAGELMPILSGLANMFANTLASNRQNIADFVKAAITGFFTFIEVVKQVFSHFATVFTNWDAFKGFLANLWTLVQQAGVLLLVLAKFIGTAVWEGVKLAAQVLWNFITHIDDFVKLSIERFMLVGKFLAVAIWEGVKLAGVVIFEFGQWIYETLKAAVTGGEIKGLGESMGTAIAEGWASAKDKVMGQFDETSRGLSDNAKKTAEFIRDVFTVNLQAAKDNMGIALNEAKGMLDQVLPDMAETLAETFGVNLEAATEAAKILIDSIVAHGEASVESINSIAEMSATFFEEYKERMRVHIEEQQASFLGFADFFAQTSLTMIDQISQSIASAIVDGQNLQQSFRQVLKSVAKEIIAALIKIGVQRLILAGITKSANMSEASTEASRSIALAGSNMMASWAGAPWPISIAAPVAGAAAMAAATGLYAAGAAAGKGAASAVAHGGLTNNPEEQTAIIHAGERVISPRQNRDLTSALENGGMGGGGVIETVNIVLFPNATNADAIFNMDQRELSDALTPAIIDGLNRAFRNGIMPEFAERNE